MLPIFDKIKTFDDNFAEIQIQVQSRKRPWRKDCRVILFPPKVMSLGVLCPYMQLDKSVF